MTRPCKACGRELVFVTNQHTGKTLPLDVASRKHIYQLSDSSEELSAFSAADQELYVSHFLVCPKADLFTGSAK